jgi:hypothetical protein
MSRSDAGRLPVRSRVLMSPHQVVAEESHANKYSDQLEQDGI